MMMMIKKIRFKIIFNKIIFLLKKIFLKMVYILGVLGDSFLYFYDFKMYRKKEFSSILK